MKTPALDLFNQQPFVPNLSEEKWMPIRMLDNYEASSFGRIRSLKGKVPLVLSQKTVKCGKKTQPLIKAKRIHFSVAKLTYEAFHGKTPEGYKVWHRDNDNQNNHLTNLYARKTLDYRKPKFIDLTNIKFGKVTAIERSCGNRKWLCICECGKKYHYSAQQLQQGKIPPCGTKRFVMPPEQAIFRTYKRGAKSRKYTFNITQEQLSKLIVSNCHYCNAKPSNKKYIKDNSQFPYNGIDRVDNDRGYEQDNCVPCCATCNRTKNSLSITEWKQWIKQVYSFYILPLEKKFSI